MLVPVEPALRGFKTLGHPFHPHLVTEWLALPDYVPNLTHDVRFAFGERYHFGIFAAFEAEWREKGLVDLIEVVDVLAEPRPIYDPTFKGKQFLVARFDQPKNALFFLLWMS